MVTIHPFWASSSWSLDFVGSFCSGPLVLCERRRGMKLKATIPGEHHSLWLKAVSAVPVPSAAHPLPAGTTGAVWCVCAATRVLVY